MPLDVTRYISKKKRTFWQALKLRLKIWKRKFDNKYVYWIYYLLIAILINLSCIFIDPIAAWFNNNSDFILGLVWMFFSIVWTIFKVFVCILGIAFIFTTIQSLFYNFIKKIFNGLYTERQTAISNNLAPFYKNADKETDLNELEKWRSKITENKHYPTAETISITIYPKIYNILLYFFPNSFKTDKEAYEYYEKFCERAEQLGEDETVFKCKKLLNNGISININLNMLSGQKTVWNYFYNNDSLCTMFNFFSYDDLKNTDLKKEIEQLYRDNWDFLESIDMCYSFDSGYVSVRNRLDITPYGLDYYLPNWSGFCKFQFWFGQNSDIFQLPTDSIICAFRECATYYLKEEECEVLENKIKSENYKDVIFHELDFAEKKAEISNKFIHVYIKIKYFSPAETITNIKTMREYYYINPFYLDDYRSS